MHASLSQRRLAAMALLVALAIPSAFAERIGGGDEFLPVDEAFRVQAFVDDGKGVVVDFQIADGYYLYRHAFAMEPAGDGLQLGETRIPPGKKKTDEFFGEVETYTQQVTLEAPVQGEAQGEAAIEVRYQGCAEAGLCYPPQTRQLTVSFEDNATPAALDGGSADDGFVAEQDRLAGVLSGSNLGWIVASFYGLGVLLAFTPCVLPMIPILSGILAGGATGAGRGFALSLAYVVAMAAAYTVFGVIAGLFGANVQAALQSPWVLVPFAAVFVGLALAMFDVYRLQLPTGWQSRLDEIGRRQSGGLTGAAVMGFLAALIVGPCLAPPLAGALLYIGESGDAVLGGTALFALGLGMGTPLLALGAAGGGVLPKAGAWMHQVQVFFGVILLGVAVWLLGRIVPGPVYVGLWAALLAGYGIYLRALDPLPDDAGGVRRTAKAGGVVGLMYAAILLAGAGAGADDPLRPLTPFASGQASSPSTATTSANAALFERVSSSASLEAALSRAADSGRPAVIDIYADWCVECKELEREVFGDPEVQRALREVAAVKLDVTAYNSDQRQALRSLEILGPPTVLFLGPDGDERRRYRLVGVTDAAGFLQRLNGALGR